MFSLRRQRDDGPTRCKMETYRPTLRASPNTSRHGHVVARSASKGAASAVTLTSRTERSNFTSRTVGAETFHRGKRNHWLPWEAWNVLSHKPVIEWQPSDWMTTQWLKGIHRSIMWEEAIRNQRSSTTQATDAESHESFTSQEQESWGRWGNQAVASASITTRVLPSSACYCQSTAQMKASFVFVLAKNERRDVALARQLSFSIITHHIQKPRW